MSGLNGQRERACVCANCDCQSACSAGGTCPANGFCGQYWKGSIGGIGNGALTEKGYANGARTEGQTGI